MRRLERVGGGIDTGGKPYDVSEGDIKGNIDPSISLKGNSTLKGRERRKCMSDPRSRHEHQVATSVQSWEERGERM